MTGENTYSDRHKQIHYPANKAYKDLSEEANEIDYSRYIRDTAMMEASIFAGHFV